MWLTCQAIAWKKSLGHVVYRVRLLVCIYTYANLRGNLYKNIIHMDPMFEVITDSHKFIYLMTSKNIDIIKMVMQFIHCAMEVRKKSIK